MNDYQRVNVGHSYFLLGNGEILYSPSGIGYRELKITKGKIYIQAKVMKQKDVYVLEWCEVLASSYSLKEIEAIAKEHYVRKLQNVNRYCRNLGFTSDKYKRMTATQKINKLRELARIRIGEYFIEDQLKDKKGEDYE